MRMQPRYAGVFPKEISFGAPKGFPRFNGGFSVDYTVISTRLPSGSSTTLS